VVFENIYHDLPNKYRLFTDHELSSDNAVAYLKNINVRLLNLTKPFYIIVIIARIWLEAITLPTEV